MNGNKIERSEIQLLWHGGFHDSPINGVLKYNDKRFWFQQCDDFMDHPEMVAKWASYWKSEDEDAPKLEWYRRYNIHELTPDELKDLDDDHELFRTHVGTHTDYNPDGSRNIGATRPQSEWNNYYDKTKDRLPRGYDTGAIIGWFEM